MKKLKHPNWCAKRQTDPRACRERGEHRSVAVAITASGEEIIGVRLCLVQAIGRPRVSYALMTFSEDGHELDYPLTFGQLRILGFAARTFYRDVAEVAPKRHGGQGSATPCSVCGFTSPEGCPWHEHTPNRKERAK